ncbi:hypothetical protein AAFF_G00364070 [Aldrovandia affinis]|uniref:Uncharacterized protein n=1 Tax=Aldrovandia affinis TaxID=143900 RepID=A0AAD7WN21_9TELE|nr:hypothetical protein AAFF_G00364070 [Aldrovandia affinis]
MVVCIQLPVIEFFQHLLQWEWTWAGVIENRHREAKLLHFPDIWRTAVGLSKCNVRDSSGFKAFPVIAKKVSFVISK